MEQQGRVAVGISQASSPELYTNIYTSDFPARQIKSYYSDNSTCSNTCNIGPDDKIPDQEIENKKK